MNELGPFVIVPAGQFVMKRNSKLVNITRFMMGKYPVTFEQYDTFATATGYSLPSDNGWGRKDRPVINVSWYDAVAYTKWLSTQLEKPCRLPSETEWEYAARGGTDTDYWWGNDIGRNNANCSDSGSRWSDKQTSPVGEFSANHFGLYDTAGNVWEWVQDCWHDDDIKGAPIDGSAWLAEDGGDESRRVARGGSWGAPPFLSKSDYRYSFTSDSCLFSLGFRVCYSLPPIKSYPY